MPCRDHAYKTQQKRNFDKHHITRPLSLLAENSPIWVNTKVQKTTGRILRPATTTHSDIVEVPSAQIWRNHSDHNQGAEELSQLTTNPILIDQQHDHKQKHLYNPHIASHTGEREM